MMLRTVYCRAGSTHSHRVVEFSVSRFFFLNRVDSIYTLRLLRDDVYSGGGASLDWVIVLIVEMTSESDVPGGNLLFNATGTLEPLDFPPEQSLAGNTRTRAHA